MSLNPRQRAFVVEYIRDKNATKAAIRAGYSAHSAAVDGPRLLENAEVASAVETKLERMLLKVESKAENIIRDLQELHDVDISDAYAEDGSLLPVHEMPAAVKRAIASLETEEVITMKDDGPITTGRIVKVKFSDRNKATEMLAKYHKLLTDKVEHEHTVSIRVVNPYAEPPGQAGHTSTDGASAGGGSVAQGLSSPARSAAQKDPKPEGEP